MIVICVCVSTHTLCCLLLCYLTLCTGIEACSTSPRTTDSQTVVIIAHWNQSREPKFIIREHFCLNQYIYLKIKLSKTMKMECEKF